MKTEVTANEKSVAITISDEKLAALEMYLEQKNIKLSDEIDKCIDGLYQKNVPQNVRDFIDMMSAKKPARKPRNFLPAETESSLSSNSPQFAPRCPVWRVLAVGGVSLP